MMKEFESVVTKLKHKGVLPVKFNKYLLSTYVLDTLGLYQ